MAKCGGAAQQMDVTVMNSISDHSHVDKRAIHFRFDNRPA
jgi:hypothetical protein